MRSLEDEVAELEKQIANLEDSPANLPNALTSKIASAALSVAISDHSSFFSDLGPSFFLHESCPPLLVSKSKETALLSSSHRFSPGQSSAEASAPSSLRNIPRSALDYMVQNYTDIHLPQYPCISPAWLKDLVDRELRGVLPEADKELDAVNKNVESPPLSHFESFVIFIALAISSSTLTWRADSQARTASSAFFASSLWHLRLTSQLAAVERLQISLLLAHYAHMNPQKVDNWICISNAVKIVTELGLHTRDIAALDHEHTKTQLFWVTFGMERSMASVLRLPLSIPESSINIKVCSIDTGDRKLAPNTIIVT